MSTTIAFVTMYKQLDYIKKKKGGGGGGGGEEKKIALFIVDGTKQRPCLSTEADWVKSSSSVCDLRDEPVLQ